MAVRSHQYFSLRWNNYQNTMTSVFQQLREDQSFVDVTLSCETGSLKAHKVVLSACSSYFQKLLLENPCKHPTIILPGDIIYNDLKTIIDFVYRGEIDVTESELQGLLRTAEQLKIKGLCETAETTDENSTDTTTNTTITVPQETLLQTQSQILTGSLVSQNSLQTNSSQSTVNSVINHSQSQQILSATTATGQPTLFSIASSIPTTTTTQSLTTTQTTTQRKARVRKRSKSPVLLTTTDSTTTTSTAQQQQQQATAAAIQQAVQQQAIVIATAAGNHPAFSNSSSIVTLNPNTGTITTIPSGTGSIITVPANSSCNTLVTGQTNQNSDTTSGNSTQQQVQQPQQIVVATSSGNTIGTIVTGGSSASTVSGTATVVNAKATKVCKTELATSNGSGVVTPGTIVTQIVVARDSKDSKNMTSLGMGMNGGILGVPMGFLDFAPEPPAPSATPVTEHVDMSCAPSSDTRDLSNSTPANGGEVRIKFETLRSLDPTETLDIDNHLAQHIIQRLDQTPIQQIQHHQDQQHQQQQQQQQHHAHHHQQQQHQQQQQQQHQQNTTNNSNNIANETNSNLLQNIKSEIIEVKQHQLHAQAHHQQTQQSQQQAQQQGQSHHQVITNATVMEIDPNNIKHEPQMIITPEIATIMNTGHMDIYNSDTSEDSLMIANGSPNDNNAEPHYTNLDQPHDSKLNGPKTWTQDDMNSALDALKNHNMSLTKASVTYGIPSTTLWQRAHRMGIETPKKEGSTKSWNEDALNSALEALRTGQISANKASKAYGIPSSTLYKIARREGIRLAAPFNAAPTTWTPEDLERALEAIRAGHTSVQKASMEFNIPTGTLYGRCKREGIELSRSNPTPWSEDAMNEALVAVRVGHMSINQAAIHYNLPYSSLYGRFKRAKYDTNTTSAANTSTASNASANNSTGNIEIIENSPENSMHMLHQFQYSPGPSTTPQPTQQQQQQQQQQHIQQNQQPQQQHHQQQHHTIQIQHHATQPQHHQQHIQQQQQDVVTSSSQIIHQQTGQIQQIYHHHTTPERS